MVVLQNEVRDLIETYLSTYDEEKSHRRRNETLYEYEVSDSSVSISMEAAESGGAYMLPAPVQKLVLPLTQNCSEIEYVEDERTGTRADGQTPNKRVDVRVDLNAATDEELRNLRDRFQ